MKASDLFIQCLEEEGIEYIFGVPGEENADFVLSLAESKKIRFILCRHEQGAAFMAEVYGRLKGHPAGCLGTLGPGATNLMTGVADGNMDRAPMLVLTGQGETTRLHKESHQIMDVVAMFRPVTKWAQSIHRAENIPEIVRKAVRLARTEKPGACHIELPEDVAAAEVEGKRPILVRRFRRPVPDDKIVDRAWEAIRAARRPIILAGNGAIRRRASKQLRRFVEKTGIGVISTFMAKGCVDMDDERCVFTAGLQARDFPVLAMEKADLIITLGYDMVEYHPRLWNPGRTHRIVHLDFLPAEIDEHYPLEVEVVGDLAHALWMLNERVDVFDADKLQFDHTHARAARKAMQADLERYKDDDAVGLIRPQKVIWEARRAMGPNDILLSDVGAHKMWIARYYHCHEPNTCLIPNGFCAMGFALPGAIAASLAEPDRRVLAICGDGGFLMNVQEMETARRLNSRIAVMVWQDNEYGLIKWKQRTSYMKSSDLAFGNPDFVALAESFGWSARRCERSADLAGALKATLEEDGPSLLVIPIDYRENELLTTRLGDIECAI
jgi:acetolactate synthase-1/2/3 large subunit